jgi:hypothetical protein
MSGVRLESCCSIKRVQAHTVIYDFEQLVTSKPLYRRVVICESTLLMVAIFSTLLDPSRRTTALQQRGTT